MNWPQIVVICWLSLDASWYLFQMASVDSRDARISELSKLITSGIFAGLLYAGGFWK